MLVPKQAVPTLSNAMDVGNPSNLVRIQQLFDNDVNIIKEKLSSYTVTDEETIQTISTVYQTCHYVLDPHGAVGYKALQNYLSENNGKGIFLATAHPVKFPEAVSGATGQAVPIPDCLDKLMQQKKRTIELEPNFPGLKNYLMQA